MRGRKHTAPGAAGWPGRLDGRGGWAGPRRVAPAGGGSPFYEGHENGRAPPWATPVLPGCRANCTQGHRPGVVRRNLGPGMKTLEGKRLKGAPGSEDQALPRKRSWSLSTPLFSWLGFKEVTYYSASALSPRRQTQPLARLNPSGGWEGGMKDL